MEDAPYNPESYGFQIDLPAAEPERIAEQMRTTFGIDPSEIIQISAKTGLGVEAVLDAIIERIPAPQGDKEAPLKAFLFDSLCVLEPFWHRD